MKVSYVEGVANHIGPESCGAARKGGVEALTGGRTGRVLSREIHGLLRKQQVLRDADEAEVDGRQYRMHRHRKVHQDPARSKTPCMYAIGNAGRNIFRDLGLKNWGVSVIKGTKFKHRLTAEFRAEFFNVLNHPILSNPNGPAGAGFNDPSTYRPDR
jgi:hypothetical protein